MQAHVTCPACRTTLGVGAAHGDGAALRCPKCRHEFAIRLRRQTADAPTNDLLSGPMPGLPPQPPYHDPLAPRPGRTVGPPAMRRPAPSESNSSLLWIGIAGGTAFAIAAIVLVTLVIHVASPANQRDDAGKIAGASARNAPTPFGADAPQTNSAATPMLSSSPPTLSNPTPAVPAPVTAGTQNHGKPDLTAGRQQYVIFPTAKVKLVRPAGFEDATRFDGFQQPSTQSSVMVVMLPGPFSEITRGFTPEQLKTRGMAIRSKEDVAIDGNSAVLLSVTQKEYGAEFAKWILAFGDDHETKLVTATFLMSHETSLSNQLKAVVLGAKTENTPVRPPGANAGLQLAASAKLRLAQSVGKTLLYTKNGVIPVKSPEDPLFVAGQSVGQSAIGDKRQFAIQRLLQTAHATIGSVTSTSEVTIDGLGGYETLADALDTASSTPLKVYQAILYDDASYVLVQGLVGAQLADEYLPEFKAMARSLSRNQR